MKYKINEKKVQKLCTLSKKVLYICINNKTIGIMEKIIKTENGSQLNYSIYNDRIDLDMISSNKKGDGTRLINELKIIASELNLNIELYSEPQDESISQEELNEFYEKNGFELHHDDVDNSYYIYK